MIRMEHINLVVTDMQRILDFYKVVFPAWRVRSEGRGEWYGVDRKWVHFGDDYSYLAFSDHGTGTARDLTGQQPGLAHFAFEIRSIKALRARMKKAGYLPSSEGADAAYRENVYYIDPDGNELEFVEYSTDEAALRNQD